MYLQRNNHTSLFLLELGTNCLLVSVSGKTIFPGNRCQHFCFLLLVLSILSTVAILTVFRVTCGPAPVKIPFAVLESLPFADIFHFSLARVKNNYFSVIASLLAMSNPMECFDYQGKGLQFSCIHWGVSAALV